MQETTPDFGTSENSEERLVAPQPQLGDQYDQSLRPERQGLYRTKEIRKSRSIIEQQKTRASSDHVIATTGIGKTTLANIFAREMGGSSIYFVQLLRDREI